MSDAHGSHPAKHPYHLVDPSPWPIVGAIAALVLTVGTVLYMHGKPGGMIVMPLGVLGILGTMFVWWRDVVREGEFLGYHSPVVQIGLRYGMALFIASEVMFFVAWFWAYFNASLFPTAAIGSVWPPEGIRTFDPFELPLLNTLILLAVGRDCHLGASCPARGRPQRPDPGTVADDPAGPELHRRAGL